MAYVHAIMTKGPLYFFEGVHFDRNQKKSVIDFEDISDEQMNQMIDGTLTEFDEGDLVDGTVVKIEHDEVLVDIGFKSEGHPLFASCPSARMPILEIVNLGDKIKPSFCRRKTRTVV